MSNFYFKNFKLVLILILWLFSSSFYFYYVKIRYGLPPIYGNIDWERYRDGALALTSLQFPEWPAKFYLSYLFYLSLSLKTYFPISGLVSNLILNLFSSILVYKISNNLFNQRAAWLALLIFLFYPYVQMWVFFIQPVSFFSFCILLLTFFVTSKVHNKTIIIFIIISSLLVLTARPNGIAIYASLIVFIFITSIKFYNKRYFYLLFISIFTIVLYFFYLSAGLSLIPIYETWFMEDIKQFGFNIPKLGTYNLSVCLGFSDSEIANLNRKNSGVSSLSFWFCSFLNNPIDVIKIFSYRVFAMLTYIKPVFSFKHNIFSVITLLPLYIFFLIALIKFYNLKINFIVISIIIYIFLSCITVVDGDNRYFSAIIPIVIIVSSGGINYFFEIFKTKLRKNY